MNELNNKALENAELKIVDVFSNIMTKEEFEAAIMHNYCVVNSGELYFEGTEEAKKAQEMIKDWIDETTTMLLPQTEHSQDLCVSTIQDIHYHEQFNAITFQAFSETENGIRTKLLSFLEFCKTLPGFKKFDAPILQTIEPVTWERK